MRHRNGNFYFALVLAALLAPASACEDEPINNPNDAGVNPDMGGSAVTFNDIYDSATFQMCADCHTPDAPGRVQGTEATMDWSTDITALSTLRGTASGLEGNFAGCNGVPFIGATSDTSLLVAVLDPDVRATFSVAGFPNCNADAIADETLRLGGPVPAALLQDLKDFIDEGGFD
ncbi:MAG: hypothetical protein IPL19_17415 [Sandaracinaceae bacterium]|nr:hypothetical protein [Sandaracinaceae bacterium]MBK7774052.1 hypothetical protein [Sandaracinaceae bacterium]MBK8409746.1 hypothetical protein [Sandaracinaceae bacterium]